MKRILPIIITMLFTASCSTLHTLIQGKLNSPFPEVNSPNLVFVEDYVTYKDNTPYVKKSTIRQELENDLRGQLALRLYGEVQTRSESNVLRGNNDSEYSKDFVSWTMTSAKMSFPADVVWTEEKEVLNHGIIYYWVRITADTKKMVNYYENTVLK